MVCVLGECCTGPHWRRVWEKLGFSWAERGRRLLPFQLAHSLSLPISLSSSTHHYPPCIGQYRCIYTAIYMYGCSCVIKEAIWLTGLTFTITYILLRLLVVVHFALVLLSWTQTHTHTRNIDTLRDTEGLWTYLGSVTAMFLSLAGTLWSLVSPAPIVGLWQGRSMNKGVKGRLCTLTSERENSIGGLTSYCHGSRHEQNWLRRPGHT